MFVHLHVHSPYSFGDGASEIEALVQQAAGLHMPALAVTDHNSVTAAVKFTQCCQGYGIKPIIGAEVTMVDQSHLTLIARTKEGFANLCRLLSRAYASGGRLSPSLPWKDLERHTGGLYCLSGCRRGAIPSLVRDHRYEEASVLATRLRDWFGPENLFLELQCDFFPQSERVNVEMVQLAEELRIGVVATNNCHYASKENAFTHALLRSVANGVTIEQVHERKPLNSEQYLKSPEQMQQLFRWCPEAITATWKIAESCENVLPEPKDLTPAYPVPSRYGCSASAYLRQMTYKGAKHRHGTISSDLQVRLDQELDLIDELCYANYFLAAWDIVRWCRQKDQIIRVTGRGSAADSAVAYALFLTEVDAFSLHLPFARFMARAEGVNAAKLPDIDLDFPNSRRDEVFAYIHQRYGKGHVARVCTYSTYWARSAVRDCGKALGLPVELIAHLAGNLHHFLRAGEIEEAFQRPELRPYEALRAPCQALMKACSGIEGLPRHLSMHSSGVVISHDPIDQIGVLSPPASGELPIVMWDKEDAPVLGINKLDILALGIHSATADAEAEINRHAPAGKVFRYDRIPRNDPLTYRVLRAGDAVGAFQAESAAERAYAAKLGPEHIDDLAAIIAQIRPGPIKSGVTHEFLALRNGKKEPRYVPPELQEVLGSTFGLVIYQEQVISMIAWCWDCSDGEADRFRKSLARHDHMNSMDKAKQEFVERTLSAHPQMSLEAVEQAFDQDISSWFAYGFTHGHALSFADTAEKSTFLSVHHPAAYFAGIMSNQPMGYYTNMSIATEARWRGVRVLPVDINTSDDKCTTPDPTTIQLGLKLVTGLRQEDVDLIISERKRERFSSLLDFCHRVPLHRDRLETLVLCGAFDRFDDGHRRGMLWALPETINLARSFESSVTNVGQGGFGWNVREITTPIAWDVERLTAWQEYVLTWQLTGVGPGCHPFAFLRSGLNAREIKSIEEVQKRPYGVPIRVAGLNIRPHQPPSRDGGKTIYTILEDEKRHLQCACRKEALEICTGTLITSPAVVAEGRVYRSGSSWTMEIERVEPLNMTLLAEESAILEDLLHPLHPPVPGHAGRPEQEEWEMGYNVATRLKALPVVGSRR